MVSYWDLYLFGIGFKNGAATCGFNSRIYGRYMILKMKRFLEAKDHARLAV